MQPNIVSETPEYFVINKPAGYSVEESEQYPSVISFLKKQHHKEASVVHRLDVETSGVVLVAKNPTVAEDLRKLWQGRAVKKTYLALVTGETPAEGEIEHSLERDNKNDRQKIALLPSGKSRPAITKYTQLAVGKFEIRNLKFEICLLECHPITGRTHQLRVHLQSIGHPILGDRLYGNKSSDKLSKMCDITRQMLHAWKLEIPQTPEYVVEPPDDFQQAAARFKIDLP